MYSFDANLVSRMKTIAKEHTLFVGKQVIPNPPCLWENIEYKDETIKIILTYEVLEPEDVKLWHLSIVKQDETSVSQQTANEIASDVLGEDAKELPLELMPEGFRTMKQFILQVA